ncbi:Putative ribonuclease H protein At1g65750, partial [Linum perenne]
LSHEKGLLFGCVFWALWKSRNELVFNGVTVSAQATAYRIASWVKTVEDSLSRDQRLGGQPVHEQRDVSWTPGPTDWLVINTDGSVKQPLSEAAAGGLVRNSSGHCLLAFTANLGSCSITRAELWGILIGLRLAWNAGYKKIIVQTDSQVAVQLLTDDSSTNHHHGLEVTQFKEFNARSWEIRIQHIYREGNRAADFLASIGHQRPIGIHSTPTSNCNLGFHLLYDVLGISESRSILSN